MKMLQPFLDDNINPEKKTAILGVGSVLRADDAAGMYFIEKLSAVVRDKNLLLMAGSTAPENFTGVIKNFFPEMLIIIDAAQMNIPIGEVRILEADEIGGMSFSTHMLPLPMMLSYLEHEVGCEVIFIGIQPESTEQCMTMCEKVKEETERLVQAFANYYSKRK